MQTMMFASRHSERSEESTDFYKEAEKLFSEHAPALLPLSSSNNISASLPRTRCRGVNVGNLLRAMLKPTFKRHLKFIEYLQEAIFQSAEIVLMQTLRLPSPLRGGG